MATSDYEYMTLCRPSDSRGTDLAVPYWKSRMTTSGRVPVANSRKTVQKREKELALPARYTKAVDYAGVYQPRLVVDREPSAACNLRP